MPTRAGSQLPADVFDGEESSLVTRLKDAGSVVLGKTAMDEFAYCEPPPTRNPLDPRRTPGGSSGGSAAAVAAGICRLAVGSQTLQSIVVPAAYCGVVGYKPTFDRLPFDGVALSPSIDTVGFLAPSVAEIRTAVAAVLPDWAEPTPRPPIVGVPTPWGDPSLVADGWHAFDRQVNVLRDHGFEIRPATLPWDDPADRRAWGMRVGDLLHGEMALVHAPWFDRYADRYGARTREAIGWGRAVTGERIEECRDARAVLADRLQERADAEGIDCWSCPSAAGVAPIGYQDTGDSSMTGLWSYAGLPAISLPVLGADGGMPRGVQLVTAPGRDEQLLGWAALVEPAFAR